MASAQEVLKRGYLTKSPPQRQALAKWKRRWCMLCDSRLVYPCAPPYVRLEYYEDETAALACKEPKGAVDLLTDKVKIETNSSFSSRTHKHVFDIITTGRVYHMSADSAPEKHEWVEALRSVVNRDEDTSVAYRSHVYHTRQASAPVLNQGAPSPQAPTKPEAAQLRRPPDKRVTNRQRPISFGEREPQKPTISDNQYYAPAAIVPRPPQQQQQQQSIAERLRSMSVNSGRRKKDLQKTISQPTRNSDYDEVAPRPPSDYDIPESHGSHNLDSDDEEDTKGPVSIRPLLSLDSPVKKTPVSLNDSDSEEDTAGPTSIVSTGRDEETMPRKLDLGENPFARKRFSHGFDHSGGGDYQNVDYSGRMKLDHAHQRTISESYEQLPSHSHLAKNIESGGYFPAGRRKTEPDTSDYHMAIPHHTVSSTQSSSRSKGNYDYVQPGARLAPTLPHQMSAPVAASPTRRGADNYDYVSLKTRSAVHDTSAPAVDGDYDLVLPRESDYSQPEARRRQQPEADGEYDFVGANLSQY